MSDNHQPDFNSSKVPFFARYLEGQFCEDLSEEEMETVQGGTIFVTLKYPSDNEEGGNDGGIATKKLRDHYDWGGGIATKKLRDHYDWGGGVVTKKYPSDSDEYAVTQKYPSDGDDQAFPID